MTVQETIINGVRLLKIATFKLGLEETEEVLGEKFMESRKIKMILYDCIQ